MSEENTEVRPRESSGASSVRFTPGSMLADRYRIVAPLGRGGMGEVYRAEDVRLGQQVALKFLPHHFAEDADKLQRLYDEVRIGRQVSHPNVCRMYDVADWEGHHFIAMEYIDGEDLSSLLRRIGKLPQDKALDIARDLCAGLAAAHGLGIIHRDLKPANVMIDGRGDARITDFGLAALAEDLEERREVAGTPAYMAPEQLAGEQVTQKTDLYALGLILYEMFTGKRLFEGSTFGEIVSQHKASSSQSSLPQQTAGLDPAVQRVILRCLERDPARRPASIHSVIAALPGGDPLRAAIDAGETPSPEMLAAASASGELKPRYAWPLLIATILTILAVAALSPRVRLYGRISLPLDIGELTFRARQIVLAQGGLERPADTAHDFGVDREYRAAARRRRLHQFNDSRFSPVYFAYRESPTAMIAASWSERVAAGGREPAFDLERMSQVILEPDGRLRRFLMVPPAVGNPGRVADFSALFRAAGLDQANATAVQPRWRPPVASDVRSAWEVRVRDRTEPLRVEAASFAGRPAWFEVIAPWRASSDLAGFSKSPGQAVNNAVSITMLLSSMFLGGFLAFRNLRRGRVDRRGSLRLAIAVFASLALYYFLVTDHYLDAGLEFQVIAEFIAASLFSATFCWLWYAALEPYLRRRWPRSLISWSRALQGRWADSLVGRHLLIGVLAGAGVTLLKLVMKGLPEKLGMTPPTPADLSFLELSGWRFLLAYVIRSFGTALFMSLLFSFMLLVAHMLMRRRAAAVALVWLVMIIGTPYENYPLFNWTTRAVIATVFIMLITRYGLLAMAACYMTEFVFGQTPPTLDVSAWYFARGLVPVVLLIAIAIFGFVRSVGVGALFAEPVLED